VRKLGPLGNRQRVIRLGGNSARQFQIPKRLGSVAGLRGGPSLPALGQSWTKRSRAVAVPRRSGCLSGAGRRLTRRPVWLKGLATMPFVGGAYAAWMPPGCGAVAAMPCAAPWPGVLGGHPRCEPLARHFFRGGGSAGRNAAAAVQAGRSTEPPVPILGRQSLLHTPDRHYANSCSWLRPLLLAFAPAPMAQAARCGLLAGRPCPYGQRGARAGKLRPHDGEFTTTAIPGLCEQPECRPWQRTGLCAPGARSAA